jgi:tetratricopeptide (TPR) repeat protein
MLWERGRAWQRPAVLAGAAILAILLATSALAQAARWKSSISLWESVIRSAPANRDYVDAYLNLGVAYSDARRPAEALRTLERAAAVDSSNADVLWNLAMLTYAGGDRKLAADRFRAVLRVSPRHSNAWYNYALVLDQLGRHEEAVPAMIQAARLGSKEAREALAGMGLTW